MRTLKKLTELGFIAIFRISVDDTIDLMHRQVEGMRDLAMKVMDEVADYYADVGFHHDDYEKYLEWWIEEQATALHSESKPSETDWANPSDAEAARMARLIDRLDDYYGSRERHVQSTYLRATSLARANGLELMKLTEKERGSYFFHAVQHIAVENFIAID